MHRIDHPTKNDDEHGAGKDGFTEGDPVAGVPPTVPMNVLDPTRAAMTTTGKRSTRHDTSLKTRASR